MGADSTRRSGEHRAPNTASGEHVTYAHFNQWTDSFQKLFDGHAQRVELQLGNMNTRLSDGSQRFTRQESEVQSLKSRTDEHSDKVKVLDEDRIKREAVSQHNQPKRAILDGIIGNVLSAGVIGLIGVAFLMWREYDKSQTATVSTTTTTTMSAPVAPPLAPAPTHVIPPPVTAAPPP
jgi:hypothetical protein